MSKASTQPALGVGVGVVVGLVIGSLGTWVAMRDAIAETRRAVEQVRIEQQEVLVMQESALKDATKLLVMARYREVILTARLAVLECLEALDRHEEERADELLQRAHAALAAIDTSQLDPEQTAELRDVRASLDEARYSAVGRDGERRAHLQRISDRLEGLEVPVLVD